ncbi:MAG: adenylate/guanylate cyclase domain-containing protein [Rhodospirillaceae bacterium]|nr:adenylate/guanylate cyclase domain-containing protein [Rhodospirillaceae bacterium]
MVEKAAAKDPAPKKSAAPKPTTAPSETDAAKQAQDKLAQERQKRTVRAEIARRREALRQQEAERALPMQILLILLNSLGTAVVAVLIAGVVIRELPHANAFADPELSKLILVMSFLLGFLITLLFLMRRLPENWWQLANEFATAQKYRAPDQKWGGVLVTDPDEYVPLFDPTRKVSEVPPSLSGADETPFAETPAPAPETADETAPETAEPQALFTADVKTEAQRTEETLAQAKAQAIAELDKFTASLNETMKSAARALDAASRFALQLYVAGACSAIARKFLLSAKDALGLMVRALSNVGTSKMFAESFVTNIEDYARREAYRPLIMDGQSAMNRQLEGRAPDTSSVLSKFETWAKQADKSAVPRVVTFLFTDIVDAAALTERLGNLHAQRVIKAHDEAVNEAIAKNKGTNVKHTGDGIIATFPDPAKAVLAAQAIQQRLDAHNKRMPHLSTNVRISINAGEAVDENGDFFGATVKMTAQLCAMAKAGQILAAEVVKSFCKSSAHAFNPFGEVTIAELDKVRAVFEVNWMRSGSGLEYSDIGQPTA